MAHEQRDVELIFLQNQHFNLTSPIVSIIVLKLLGRREMMQTMSKKSNKNAMCVQYPQTSTLLKNITKISQTLMNKIFGLKQIKYLTLIFTTFIYSNKIQNFVRGNSET